jgi:hypothetical protein
VERTHLADPLVVTCPACVAGAGWLDTHEPRAVVPATLHRHASQDGWFRLYAPAAWADPHELAAITGKYLFFSPDRAALIGVAGVELAPGFRPRKCRTSGPGPPTCSVSMPPMPAGSGNWPTGWRTTGLNGLGLTCSTATGSPMTPRGPETIRRSFCVRVAAANRLLFLERVLSDALACEIQDGRPARREHGEAGHFFVRAGVAPPPPGLQGRTAQAVLTAPPTPGPAAAFGTGLGRVPGEPTVAVCAAKMAVVWRKIMPSSPEPPVWTWPFAPRRRVVTLRVRDRDVRFPPELKALPRETDADWMQFFWASLRDAEAIVIALSSMNELLAVWAFPLSVWDDPHASLLPVLTPLARVPASRIEVVRRTGQPDAARERAWAERLRAALWLWQVDLRDVTVESSHGVWHLSAQPELLVGLVSPALRVVQHALPTGRTFQVPAVGRPLGYAPGWPSATFVLRSMPDPVARRTTWFDGWLWDLAGNAPMEQYVAAAVDRRQRIIAVWLAGIGNDRHVTVSSRHVFLPAVILDAAGVIIMHSHPSAPARPSDNDLRHTRRTALASALAGVPLLDSIILGYEGFCSLRALAPDAFTAPPQWVRWLGDTLPAGL